MTSNWIILDKYPFSLLDGQASIIDGKNKSYYDYLNRRSPEVGKNVQCLAWLLNDFPVLYPSVEEPFGGCGVFSIAIQEILYPCSHRVMYIDEQCVSQLQHALSPYHNVQVTRADAHERAGLDPAELYVCEFPFFTHDRLQRDEWRSELHRMASHRPAVMLITDGSSSKWHLIHLYLQKRGLPVDADRTSYVRFMSARLWEEIGYSITRCAYHSSSFYFRCEPSPPGEILYRYMEPGSGPRGLRPADTEITA